MTAPLKIGIRLHDTVPGALKERLAFVRAQGFCCAHIALSKLEPGFRMPDAPKLLTPEYAQSLKESFASQGMDCVLLGCYLQLAQADDAERERVSEIYRAHIRFARQMGAMMVGTETPAKGLAFSEPITESEEAYQLFLRALRPLVRTAEEEDVLLGIEPVFCDIISTPARAERMLDEIGSDHLRIILDAVNLLSNEAALDPEPVIEDAIHRLGDRVALMHMKDFQLREGAARPDSVACGLGGMRYDRLVAFASGRGLPMTLENTTPDNAKATRLFLERIAAE